MRDQLLSMPIDKRIESLFKQVRHCHDLRDEFELHPLGVTGKHKNIIELADPEKEHSVRDEFALHPWRMTGKHTNFIEPDDSEKKLLVFL